MVDCLTYVSELGRDFSHFIIELIMQPINIGCYELSTKEHDWI